MTIYSGTVTAPESAKEHLESLGMALGERKSNGDWVVKKCSAESLKRLESFFGEYTWSLFPTNGFEFAEDKVEWFLSSIKVRTALKIRVLQTEAHWSDIVHISQRNKFFVIEKSNGYTGQNALIDFSSVKFLPAVPNHPYPDRFCFNGWMYCNASEIEIP